MNRWFFGAREVVAVGALDLAEVRLLIGGKDTTFMLLTQFQFPATLCNDATDSLKLDSSTTTFVN
jgi:hypothetical protein